MKSISENATPVAINRKSVEVVQINMGNRCNQACTHCHIGASPKGNKNMNSETARKVLEKLKSLDIRDVEFTGGTPEMNPNLSMLIESLSGSGRTLSVRSSLSVLNLPEYSHFIEFYRKHSVKIIASFPAVFSDAMDRQRGKGSFDSSVSVIQKLNKVGYGTNGGSLELVYNSTGAFLPPSQKELEHEFKEILKKNLNLSFNNLVAIVNSPIGRYRKELSDQKKLDEYLELLKRQYNSETLNKVMCRDLLSIDFEGYVYDCDFNNALRLPVKGYEKKKFWEIDFTDFNPTIPFLDHCYACTVNSGSSCRGELLDTKDSGESSELNVTESVKSYYGEELKGSHDLKTTACCTLDSIPDHVKEVLPYIADEVKMKYYGCGSPVPVGIKNLSVLDLGCGTGRDSFIISKLVGENGFVHGIDMTDEQIGVAKKYLGEHTKRFGYQQDNIKFTHDYIESIPKHVEDGSVDLAVSNCVINLVKDKEKVLGDVFRALKQGGEFYFSDVYSDRRIPDSVKNDHVLYGECLGGALYYKDFERISARTGFTDPRIVSRSEIEITDPDVKKLVGNIRFYSVTYRLWKIKGLEDACEDYGHFAVYKGSIEESPEQFELDGDHVFERNRPEKVCGNTALMLSATRYKDAFKVIGSFDEHFGLFQDCGGPDESEKGDSSPGGCC